MKFLLYALALFTPFLFSCKGDKKSTENSKILQVDASKFIKGDSMVYGLACEGSSDTAIIVYPFDGGDPVTYNCLGASKQKMIIGKPQTGDWVGLVLDKEDSTTATMVINLDQLKGTWTYAVMPTFKEFKNLSKRMQKRMEKEALENMPDSVKETYLVPREYGFTLKRGHAAQAVGHIFSNSDVEEDSPVEYPAVRNYRQWFMWNGRLILVSADGAINATEKKDITYAFDTLNFVSLDNDSLVLTQNGIRYGFHRKESTIKANEAASQKVKEAEEKVKEKYH